MFLSSSCFFQLSSLLVFYLFSINCLLLLHNEIFIFRIFASNYLFASLLLLLLGTRQAILPILITQVSIRVFQTLNSSFLWNLDNFLILSLSASDFQTFITSLWSVVALLASLSFFTSYDFIRVHFSTIFQFFLIFEYFFISPLHVRIHLTYYALTHMHFRKCLPVISFKKFNSISHLFHLLDLSLIH